MKYPLQLFFASLFINISYGQNLPSLITERNINSTFSIIGYDPQTREWGIAVATNNIYVGNSTCYIEPGIGAFSVIAETEPMYAFNGFEQLKQGASIEQAILFTKAKDSMADYRQVSAINQNGEIFAFTGSSLKHWPGIASHRIGKYYAVMGNQLAPETLQAMAATFEATKGTLAERLLATLVAGDKAGGQVNGKQSAALLVKGMKNEWFNQIDLRVDHSAEPFGDLQRLLHYHYGRIMINRATAAINRKDSALGRDLLAKGIELTKGWYGMYSRIAKAYLLLGEEKAAVKIIKQALAAEPRWYKNLPAFYSLYHHSVINKAYPLSAFSEADWNVATSMYIDLKRYDEALASTQKIRLLFPNSSQNFFLQAKVLSLMGNKDAARVALKEVLRLEPDHADATRLARIIGY